MRKQLLLGFLSLLILISLLLGGCSPKPLYWGYIPHGLLTDLIIVCYSINYNEISQGKPLDVTLYFEPLDVYLNNPEAKTVCTVTMNVLDKQEKTKERKNEKNNKLSQFFVGSFVIVCMFCALNRA